MAAYSGPVDVLPVEHDLYELTKNEPANPDDPALVEEDQDVVITGATVATFLAVVVRDTKDTAAWLRHQHETNSLAWALLCLMLQRSARNIPPLAPSAFVAAQAVPFKYRVHKQANFKRGMVGFSWNPDNPGFGHIFFILGRNVDGKIIVWTNDARQRGSVDIVEIDFFVTHWGHKIQFASTWLNGFEFPDFHEVPDKPDPVKLDGNLRDSIKELKHAIIFGEEANKGFKDHPKIQRKLERNLEDLKELQKLVSATHNKKS